MKVYTLLLLTIYFGTHGLSAQQVPDTTFVPAVLSKTKQLGANPIICIDSAHNNLHTLNGGFKPFARLMAANGFEFVGIDKVIVSTTMLTNCDIYVIVNPLHESNIGNWRLPNPSAFTANEILLINTWVKEGGNLFLVADHMPFAGAAFELAKSFGFQFSNGFANLSKSRNQPDYFTIENGRLNDHKLLNGEIESLTSFTGSGFIPPEGAEVIMKFKNGDVSLEPEIAWQFSDTTKTISLSNYAQGAIMKYGNGKISVFAEAAMFTAQIVTNQQGSFNIGFTSRIAPNNQLFAVQLMNYLIDEY